tara:strand:- start:5397 stop:5648 length:252 start_codon:yes stop_codon:yes gene_type:complete
MKFKKVKEIECRIYCNPSLLLSEEFAKQIKKINEKCGGDFVIPGENELFYYKCDVYTNSSDKIYNYLRHVMMKDFNVSVDIFY